MARLPLLKTVRTFLYGDSQFTEWELDLLHTPIMQRLYNLKQLGFTDKVYPDAIHSRFNHILGVTERADKILNGVIASLHKEEKGNLPKRSHFKYYSSNINKEDEIQISDLIKHVESRRWAIRLMALLHDITHIPYGHTLEDELHIFNTKHDSPERQVEFFNILIKELLFGIVQTNDPNFNISLLRLVKRDSYDTETLEPLISAAKVAVERIKEKNTKEYVLELEGFLLDIEIAMKGLFFLDDLHKDGNNSNYENERKEALEKLLITDVILRFDIDRNKHGEKWDYKDFDVHIDGFALDVIGNTICADLLDYIKRDTRLAGLKSDYDDRIFKYYTLASTKESSPDNKVSLRLCLQLFTNKLRYDISSEIVIALMSRYLLSERVLFHPTKCAAGAMLGAAVHMLGIDKAIIDFYKMGDAEFLKYLEEFADDAMIISQKVNDILIGKDGSINHPIFDSNSEVGKIEELLQHSEIYASSSDKQNYFNLSFAKIYSEEKDFVTSGQPILNDNNDSNLIQEVLKRISERMSAANLLIWQLKARQFHKKVFRVAEVDNDKKNGIGEYIAKHFQDANARYKFERKVELQAGLPYGSIVIHCPKHNTALKGANVLTFGVDSNEVKKFKDIDDFGELAPLHPYIKQTKALEEAYECIWNLYVFVHPSQMNKWTLIEEIIPKLLAKESPKFKNIENSKDIHHQLITEFRHLSPLHVEVRDILTNREGDLIPAYNKEMFDYIETVEADLFRSRKGNLTANDIVNEWVKVCQNMDESKKANRTRQKRNQMNNESKKGTDF